ncbi:MAG: hypothetical protein H0X37_21100, partial [Herpetosiphonaceae bacterium]|nr:hypothetical protein [Herpetosiphonaceae bacterium]
MFELSHAMDHLLHSYPEILSRLDHLVTGEAFFSIFRQLSDNYSPTLTVTRVQAPLVKQILAQGPGNQERMHFDPSLRRSGSMAIRVGTNRPALWLSAHADICSYLTGPWDGSGYPLTPFCTHNASPGRRAAMALATPRQPGPLERLCEGEMVTLENNTVRFECTRTDLPFQTRVVHHLAAAWDRASDHLVGFLDNEGGSTALILAAQILSHYDANALLLLNDEEEGPVDRGNQGFSRAANRLLHRTPLDEHPDYVVVVDGHSQAQLMARGIEPAFGQGASFTGVTSLARGAVTPPQLLAFTRELALELGRRGISLVEDPHYVGRSDDISAMQWTPNVSIIGYP